VVLGGQSTPLDCTGANLASGDFRGADLRGLVLTGAQANGAILASSQLDGAVLDQANLQDAVMQDASLQSFQGHSASLRGIKAQGASFVRANLSGADLTRAQMGATAYLFTLSGSSVQQLVTELDQDAYPQPDLIQVFTAHGVTLSSASPVKVLLKGKRWQIQDANGPYVLLLNMTGDLDVSSASDDLRPAVLRQAICLGTKAPGAILSGADLRGVQWYSSGATLDHADLGGAVLAGSLLEGTDFTQAYLAGADLSQCVLVQSRFRGCVLGPDENRRAFSLEGSLLQGTDFTNATLLSALLVDAAVALPQGVPLFSLPTGSQQKLNQQGLTSLSNLFSQAGYPLGSTPTIAQVQFWLLDNRNDPDSSMPQLYRVQMVQGQLSVFDGEAGTYLFSLPPGSETLLASPTPPQVLVADFSQNSYSLDPKAPITFQKYWDIRVSADAPQVKAASYPRLHVFPSTAALPVYGSILVALRDWPQYSNGLAFSATQALDAALNPTSLGPSGYPRAWVDQKILDWETLMTVGTKQEH
ncbi:MAG: pentapeptide repeat-containing protein, partial [Chloroflexota bacterium]|nr:pentapeptide repeat-containing protein [Chloroflexota bacterium]